MITVENLSKSFGSQTLFKEVSFQINARERIGLVGRNGHGKTTLLRILIGEEDYDGGRIQIPKRYRLGYVRQELAFRKETVLQEGMLALGPNERDHHWKVEKILFGLGFTASDMDRHPREFSGGFQVRLNLAKILISEPNLLLLDEPTNYLDITSIRWIESFLAAWPHELLLVTHDRGFMDKIVTHTMGLHRQGLRKLEGDTGKYYDQMALQDEIYEKTRLRDERKRKEIELFITRFRAKARLANLVQSRIKTLAKTESREKLAKLKTLDFSFREAPFPAKFVLKAGHLTFGYQAERPLIRDFKLAVRAGEKICMVGANGRGKTTLLKLLAQTLTPQSGDVEYHSAVQKGIFEQTNLRNLQEENTIEEELRYANPDVSHQLARTICGAMLFSGAEALKKIRILSGGEKSRVMLGKILATPANLLFLDEPTHHLDMDACDALLAAIDAFAGSVILVTHNEMFLHALAQRLIIFQGDRIEVFEGSYQRFLEKGGWLDDAGLSKSSLDFGTEPAAPQARLSKKELKRLRSEIISQRNQTLKPLEDRVKELEELIEADEKKLHAAEQAMLEASQTGDGLRIGEIGKEIHKLQTRIETCFTELEDKSMVIEAESKRFNKRLDDLSGD